MSLAELLQAGWRSPSDQSDPIPADFLLAPFRHIGRVGRVDQNLADPASNIRNLDGQLIRQSLQTPDKIQVYLSEAIPDKRNRVSCSLAEVASKSLLLYEVANPAE